MQSYSIFASILFIIELLYTIFNTWK